MALVFTYTKSPVSIDRLSEEIRTSAISVALDHINLFGMNLDIFFKDDLTAEDVGLLDALVAAHTGEPTPEEENKAIAIGTQVSAYAPSPNSVEIGKASVTVDADRKMITRGQTLTDEGSFRDSFAGTSLFTIIEGMFSFSTTSDEIVGDGTVDVSGIRSVYPYLKRQGDADSAFTQGAVSTPYSISLEEMYKGVTGNGNLVVSNWFPTQEEGASISVSNSRALLATGLAAGSVATLFKQIDYLPIRLQINAAVSQRIANQTFAIGLHDETDSSSAIIEFSGTNNKVVIFRTTSDSENSQETVCTIPFGKTSAADHIYTIEVVNGMVALLIDNQPAAQHRDHVPHAYDSLGIIISAQNSDAVATSGTLSIHWVSFQNVNQLDITNSFSSVPVSTRLASPSSLDGKPMVATTARPVGTYTYLSSKGDDFSDPTSIDHGTPIVVDHKIGDPAETVIYFDINAIVNETHIHTAVLQWGNARLDCVECEIVPRVTTVGEGSGTNYTTVSGVLVATPPGYGNKTVDWNNVHLVEMVTNEFGVRPAGYWDATFNSSTKTFENITFNSSGNGQFNIFTEEIEFQCFVPCFTMINDGIYEIKSNDESRLGHNMRIKIIANTAGEDHDWQFTAAVSLFRKRTC